MTRHRPPVARTGTALGCAPNARNSPPLVIWETEASRQKRHKPRIRKREEEEETTNQAKANKTTAQNPFAACILAIKVLDFPSINSPLPAQTP